MESALSEILIGLGSGGGGIVVTLVVLLKKMGGNKYVRLAREDHEALIKLKNSVDTLATRIQANTDATNAVDTNIDNMGQKMSELKGFLEGIHTNP